MSEHDTLTGELLAFVRRLGIAVIERDLPQSFLPGLDIGEGAVLLDRARLAHPGDILHEAGHVAVAPPDQRAAPAFTPDGGDEMAAIAWSFAAAKAIDLDPAILFHPGGYKGGSEAYLEAFTGQRYFGVPLLGWYGMCVDPQRRRDGDPPPYPHMLRWVR